MRRPILLLCACVAAPASGQAVQSDLSVTVYNQNLALVQDTRQIDLPSGRSRQEFPNVSGQISPETVTRERSRFRRGRAEFRFRPALALQADGEGRGRDDHPGAHQSGHRRRAEGAGQGARGQWRRGPPDRRAHRGASRRRPPGPGHLRQGAGKSARPAHFVGDHGEPPRRPAADHAQLPDARNELESRLRHFVRRGRRDDRRPGLDHADQLHRNELRECGHIARRGRCRRQSERL